MFNPSSLNFFLIPIGRVACRRRRRRRRSIQTLRGSSSVAAVIGGGGSDAPLPINLSADMSD
jgi:hypothetical protein